jgi:hypothetical protein
VVIAWGWGGGVGGGVGCLCGADDTHALFFSLTEDPPPHTLPLNLH